MFTSILPESNNLSVGRVLDRSTEDLRVEGVLFSTSVFLIRTHSGKYIFAMHSSVVVVSGSSSSEH